MQHMNVPTNLACIVPFQQPPVHFHFHLSAADSNRTRTNARPRASMTKLIVPIPESAPAAAGRLFGVDEGSLVSIKLAQNHTYSATRDGQKVILRITPEEHHSLASVTAQVQFVRYLRDQGVSVCEPLPSPAGNLVESLQIEDARLFVSSWRFAVGTRPVARYAVLSVVARILVIDRG